MGIGALECQSVGAPLCILIEMIQVGKSERRSAPRPMNQMNKLGALECRNTLTNNIQDHKVGASEPLLNINE